MSTDAIQNEMLRDHERRLAALEYNLGRVLAHLRLDWESPPAPDSLPQEALDLLARGDKLRAIQVLVTKLGITLAEAKLRVERGR